MLELIKAINNIASSREVYKKYNDEWIITKFYTQKWYGAYMISFIDKYTQEETIVTILDLYNNPKQWIDDTYLAGIPE